MDRDSVRRAVRIRESQHGQALDQHLPQCELRFAFRGYKASGYGRENREETVKEYTQVTSVWVETDENMRDPFVVG